MWYAGFACRRFTICCMLFAACLLIRPVNPTITTTVNALARSGQTLTLTQISDSGPRQVVLLLKNSPPITCPSCDPNRPQEVKVEDFILRLANSTIFVFHSCDSQCVLSQTLDFDPSICSPSYLQPSVRVPNHLYVICDSRPRVLPVIYDKEFSNFSIRPYQEASGTSVPANRSAVVGGIRDNKNTDFLVWIASDRQSIGFHAFDGRENPDSFPVADTSCDVFEALHSMDPTSNEGRPRFLLHCSQNNAAKLYEVIINFDRGELRSSAEIPGFGGSLVLSPNSTYLCLWTESSITVFQTADYSKQQFMSFDSPIVAAYFVPSDSPNPRLYVSAGSATAIINVAEFFSDPNTGVFPVPALAGNCASDGRCLPQRLSSDRYLVVVRSGSTWQALIYHVDELTEPLTVINLSEPPASAFLQLTSSPSPTPESEEVVGIILGISIGLGVPAVVAVTVLVALLLSYCWRRGKSPGKSTERPYSDLTLEHGTQFRASSCSPEAEKVKVKESTTESKPDESSAPPSLPTEANPTPDKSRARKETLVDPPEITVNDHVPEAQTLHTQASAPLSKGDKLAYSRPERTITTLDCDPSRHVHLTPRSDRQSTPTHHLTPRSDHQDSGVDTPLSTISSASLTSLPSDSRSSSAMGRISPRSNSPADGCSLSGDDQVPPGQVCSNSSSSGATEMVAPAFSQHPTCTST